MIFKAALKYKIYEWALDSIFNKIIKNFAIHKSDMPHVVIYKINSGISSGIPSGGIDYLVCETIYMGRKYRASISLEIIQDIISAFGYNSEETAGEIAVIYTMEFYEKIVDVEFLDKLEDVLFVELKDYFKHH